MNWWMRALLITDSTACRRRSVDTWTSLFRYGRLGPNLARVKRVKGIHLAELPDMGPVVSQLDFMRQGLQPLYCLQVGDWRACQTVERMSTRHLRRHHTLRHCCVCASPSVPVGGRFQSATTAPISCLVLAGCCCQSHSTLPATLDTTPRASMPPLVSCLRTDLRSAQPASHMALQ